MKHPYRYLIVIALCGIGISVAIFFLLKNWEEESRFNEFRYKANDHAAAIQTEFEHVMKNVSDMRFLIEHDINLEQDDPSDPDDFMPMVEQLILHDPDLHAIAWSIKETIGSYSEWPIIYRKIMHGQHDVILGEDYAHYISSVANLSQNVLTHAFVHPNASGQDNYLSFIAMVENTMQEKGEHNQNHIGALIVQLNLSTVIERSLAKLPVSSQDIHLFLLHEQTGKQRVYTHVSRSRSPSDKDLHTGIMYSYSFYFAGLTWQLDFEAAPYFLEQHPIFLAWMSLAFCLSLTFCFVWFGYFTSKQKGVIEQEVIERTAELAQSEQRLRLAMEGTSGGVWDWNIQTNTMYFSPSWEQMLGYAIGDIDPHHASWESMVHSEDLATVMVHLQQHLNHHTDRYEAEYRIRTKDDSWLWVLDRGKVLEWRKDGQALRAVGTYTDINEKKLAEQKLQHLDRVESLGVLAGGIAHDFNNLLTAILGNASLAQIKLEEKSPALQHLETIEAASYSAADLCKQMLAYSGKGKFIIKAVHISHVVESMAKLISVSMAKNIVVKYHLNQQLPSIDADIAQIQQVVLNLITNASESMEGKGGIITLTTGVMFADTVYLDGCIGDAQLQAGRYVYIEVSDTGCGMDEHVQNKMFDPFFTTKFTGRGLGMSAMLGIVKGHHGGLRIYSEVGEGTSIKITFPLSKGEDFVEDDPVSDVSTQNFSGTVLVVDDEENVRKTAQAMLEYFGFKVLSANDGLEGVKVFRQYQDEITLVLLDMTMPKMNGTACFHALRQIKGDVAVILSSGYNEQDAINRFTGKGLAGFLQKPYTSEKLAQQLQHVMDQHLS